MTKLKYNFKSFFQNDYNSSIREYHNDDWVSNGHFIIKKSILTKTHLKVVEKHPQNTEIMNKCIEIAEQSKEIFEDKREDRKVQFIPDYIMDDFSESTGTIVYDSNLDMILRQDYYNFITDRKCKIYMGAGRLNPLPIYSKYNEFVGVVLPVRNNHLDVTQNVDITKEGRSYQDYITKLKEQQEEEKRIRAERKKAKAK